MKRRLATVAGIAALGLLSSVSPAAAHGPIGVMIEQRTCRTETPAQIVLVHSPGSITCYGGRVGHLHLGGANGVYVQSVHAGGYTGAIGWSNGGSGGGAQFFSPGDVFVIGRNCIGLDILPGS